MWWKRRRFVRGDWGAIITELMGAQAPKGLLGIHTNMANVIPADIDEAAFSGALLGEMPNEKWVCIDTGCKGKRRS